MTDTTLTFSRRWRVEGKGEWRVKGPSDRTEVPQQVRISGPDGNNWAQFKFSKEKCMRDSGPGKGVMSKSGGFLSGNH